MPVSPLSAAKYVCQLKSWQVTNLEINKILYIATLIFMGKNNSATPLVYENFQAWDYGPVLPSVYHKLKAYGNAPVQDVFLSQPDIGDCQESASISEAVNLLTNMSPGQMVAITHWENGAWAKNYQAGCKGIVIPNQEVLAEYHARTAR